NEQTQQETFSIHSVVSATGGAMDIQLPFPNSQAWLPGRTFHWAGTGRSTSSDATFNARSMAHHVDEYAISSLTIPGPGTEAGVTGENYTVEFISGSNVTLEVNTTHGTLYTITGMNYGASFATGAIP